MPFRVKDVLIDVLQPQPCPQHTLIFCHFTCTRFLTICHFGCTFQFSCHINHSLVTCGHCSVLHSFCGPISQGCGITFQCPGGSIQCPGGSIACPGSLIDPGQLNPGVIRERLQEQLKLAQAEEDAAAEAMRPQTLEQIDLLEGKLKEVLGDLEKRRAELRKQK